MPPLRTPTTFARFIWPRARHICSIGIASSCLTTLATHRAVKLALDPRCSEFDEPTSGLRFLAGMEGASRPADRGTFVPLAAKPSEAFQFIEQFEVSEFYSPDQLWQLFCHRRTESPSKLSRSLCVRCATILPIYGQCRSSRLEDLLVLV